MAMCLANLASWPVVDDVRHHDLNHGQPVPIFHPPLEVLRGASRPGTVSRTMNETKKGAARLDGIFLQDGNDPSALHKQIYFLLPGLKWIV
jgi:hypothetical protein